MKSTRNTFLKVSASALVVALTSLVFACQSTSFDLAAAKTEIETANKKISDLINKKDSAGVATEIYTSDAKFMITNGPTVVGTKNIQSVFSAFINEGNTLVLTTTEIWGDENVIAEEGTFVTTRADGISTETGKYLVLWKKEDGKWKIFRDCYNTDSAAPAAK